MTLKLYKIDTSPPVRAVMMTAEILKLNYETQDVDLMGGEHLKPEYVEKNPLHSVPLLEDGDFLLADSHAIITYLVSKYGAKQRATLYPNDLSLRATVDQRMYFESSILFTTIIGVIKNVVRKGITSLPSQYIEEANAGYDILEKYLQKTKFVACDHLTVADVSCVASISTLAAIVPVDEKYTKVNAWWNALKKEDWYQKKNVPGVTQFEGFIKSKLDL